MRKSFQLSKPWADKKKGLRKSPKRKIKNLGFNGANFTNFWDIMF